MKKLILTISASLLAWASPAATLIPVNITGSNITCMLSTNCTVVTNRATDTFVLPNSTGEGILESLVFEGQANATGSNLYSYFYRVDLSGVTALNSNLQGCFTNVVTCAPGGPFLQTNLVCVTNIVVPGVTNIVCSTNVTTNSGCVTNTVPCPGATPCIEALRIRAGSTTSLSIPGPGGPVIGEVFVVTSGGTGTVALASVQQTGAVITVTFASPLCPGSSSLYFGFVSTNEPDDITAKLLLNNDATLNVDVLAPDVAGQPIDCDFSALRAAIVALGPEDLRAPNNRAREGRRGALLNAVKKAIKEAQQGDLEGVLDALQGITAKVQKKHKWFSDAAAAQLADHLVVILDCLGEHNEFDNDDGNGKGKGKGNGHGHPHENGNKPGKGPKK
jgi:hypothetical protein